MERDTQQRPERRVLVGRIAEAEPLDRVEAHVDQRDQQPALLDHRLSDRRVEQDVAVRPGVEADRG